MSYRTKDKAALPSSRGTVALVGRPNVGKSTLFNILTATRRALVKDQAGVTRDVKIEPGEWGAAHFDVMDTGGLTEGKDPFAKLIRKQVMSYLAQADLIVVVMDGRAGICPEDKDVLTMVQQTKKPFLLVVNKVDRAQDEVESCMEFQSMGAEQVLAASFERRRNVDDILDWIVTNLPDKPKVVNPGITIAVIGKPNAGKSSLCNLLIGEERLIVSDIAGTTIDAIDMQIQHKGKTYNLIDTAGLRRQARRKEGVESFRSLNLLMPLNVPM